MRVLWRILAFIGYVEEQEEWTKKVNKQWETEKKTGMYDTREAKCSRKSLTVLNAIEDQ